MVTNIVLNTSCKFIRIELTNNSVIKKSYKLVSCVYTIINFS